MPNLRLSWILLAAILLQLVPAARVSAQEGGDPAKQTFAQVCGCFHTGPSGVYPLTFDTCDGENFFTPGVVDTTAIVGGEVDDACYQFTNLTVGQYDDRGLLGILRFDTQTPISSCAMCGTAPAPAAAPLTRDDRCESLRTVELPERAENLTFAGESGQYLVVAGPYATFVLSLSQPDVPTLVGTADVHGSSAAARGNTVYIAGDEGVRWIDVTDPTSPQVSSESLGVDIAYGVAVEGDLLFVAAWKDGLIVYDISDPQHPVETDRVGGWLLDKIAVEGSVVAAVDNLGSLILFDVSDPAKIAPKGVMALEASGLGSVRIQNKRAYVASPDQHAIFIIDIADPETPVQIGAWLFSGVATDTALAGDRLYVTLPENGEMVELDVSDPAQIKDIFNSLPLPHAQHVISQGPYAYVQSWDGSIMVLSCPSSRAQAGSMSPSACRGPAAELYAAGSNNLHPLDTAIRLGGKLYEIYFISTDPALQFTVKNLVTGAENWATQQGITGLMVTEDGKIVTDPTTIRDVLLAVNAAYDLYTKPQEVSLPSLDAEYSVTLDGLRGAFLGAMSPAARLQHPQFVLQDTVRKLLEDQTVAADLSERLTEASTDDAEPVEELASKMVAVTLEKLSDKSKFPGLEEDVAAVTQRLKESEKVLRSAELVSFAVKLLAVMDMQTERATWLRDYIAAFPSGEGALSQEQASAADAVLQETDDLGKRRIDHAVGVIVDFAASKLGELAVKSSERAVEALATKYSASLLGSLAAAVPMAFSVNGALYGTDELIADFRQGREAEALLRVFADSRQKLIQQAKDSGLKLEDGTQVYDGDLATKYRSAYLLETAAAALSNRLYGTGYQAIYRLPNFSMLLDLVQGGIGLEAAQDMVRLADEVERRALNAMLQPSFLNEALTLATSTCGLDTRFERRPSATPPAPPISSTEVAYAGPIVNKIPDLNALDLLLLGTPGSPALGVRNEERLVVYDLGTGRERFRVEPEDGLYSAAGAFGADILVTCSKRGEMTQWSTLTGKPTLTYDQEPVPAGTLEGPGCQVQLGDDGDLLFSTYGGKLYFWNTGTGRRLGELDLSPGRMLGVAVGTSADEVLVGNTLTDVQLRSVPELDLREELPVSEAEALGIVGYGDYLLTRTLEEVSLWNTLFNEKVRSVSGAGFWHSVAVSEDKLKVAVRASPETVEIWTVHSRQDPIEVQTISEHDVSALTFGPEGDLLYVADNKNGEVRVWDLTKIAEPAPVRPEAVKATVLVDKLNVRSGPSKDDKVLAQVNAGEVLQVLDGTKDREWLMVCCVDGQPGWVFNSPEYVRVTPEDGLDRLLYGE